MKKPLAILLTFSLLSPYFVSAQSDPCQDMDRETTELSMMPEGLLEYLDAPDIINLFAYLQSLDPIPIE